MRHKNFIQNFETIFSKFSKLYVMVRKIGIEWYYKHCAHFHTKHFAKIRIIQFVFSFLIVTHKSLFRILIGST